MKKLILLSVMMMAASFSFAQSKVNWEVKGGLNMSTFTRGGDWSFNHRTVWRAGAAADISIGKGVYIQPSVFFSEKGVNHSDYLYKTYGYQDLHLSYIEIPVNLMYRFPLSKTKDISLDLALGPYYAYGVNGKAKYSTGTKDLFKESKFKRNDFGVNAELCFDVYHFLVGAAVQIGFTDLKSNNFNNYCFNLNVGYRF
ncbi:MAG: PorT family protein [Bacteroidales bacterium]|jgi:hypothetical protein|nr:PorT family protein [Bacteroidales bacterium]MCI1734065.1 PorT family protein [Bacteroidales bacterium]